MALSKQKHVDKIESIKVLDHYTINIREVTEIIESGKIISQAYTRYIVYPDHDASSLTDDVVKAQFEAIMTNTVKANYQTFLEAQKAQEAELNSK